MPSKGGRYVMRGGKRELVHNTKATPAPKAEKPPASKAEAKPAKATKTKKEEGGDV